MIDVCSRPECVELRRHVDYIARLQAVARAAEKLIYPPRTEYAKGSKKAALRDALVALGEPDGQSGSKP